MGMLFQQYSAVIPPFTHLTYASTPGFGRLFSTKNIISKTSEISEPKD
jgi:hypothetical protein